MTTADPFICLHCVRFQGIDLYQTVGHCTAFGDAAIPIEIIEGRTNHLTTIAGDHGLLFRNFDGVTADNIEELALEPADPSPLPDNLEPGELDDQPN